MTTRHEGGRGGARSDALAPIIPLFGGIPNEGVANDTVPPDTWHASWITDADLPLGGRTDDDRGDGDGDGDGSCGAIEREIAERNLMKKLRGRQLSMAEARPIVAERDLSAAEVDEVLATFVARRYLDDAALAHELVRTGVERKGQGRHAIAQSLAKRGIPRAAADAALATLPNDDDDRALDYARSKIGALARLDRDTAVRRLVGQLSRRGYPGSIALSAARTAWEESSRGE